MLYILQYIQLHVCWLFKMLLLALLYACFLDSLKYVPAFDKNINSYALWQEFFDPIIDNKCSEVPWILQNSFIAIDKVVSLPKDQFSLVSLRQFFYCPYCNLFFILTVFLWSQVVALRSLVWLISRLSLT